MRGAPIPPAEYDGEHLDTDAKLEEEGWAAGLDVWGPVGKGYADTLGDGTVANAQLWSLRAAVRRQLVEELLSTGGLPDSYADAAMEIAGTGR